MKHLVTVKKRKIDRGTTAYDSYGAVSASSTAWETVCVRRAKIDALNATEAQIARQVYPTASHRVILDYDATLASTGANRCAILWNDRFLHVAGVINVSGWNWQLEVLCGEER